MPYYDADGNAISEVFDESGKPVKIDGPANLRAELKSRNDAFEELQAKYEALAAAEKERSTAEALKDFDPRVAEFVKATGLDPKVVSEFGDLFGGAKPAESATQSTEGQQTPEQAALAAQFEAMQRTQANTAPSGQTATEAENAILKAFESGDPAQIAAAAKQYIR